MNILEQKFGEEIILVCHELPGKDINKKYGVTRINDFFIVYGLVLFKLYTFKYPKYIIYLT